MSEKIAALCTALENWNENDENHQNHDEILNDIHLELVRLQSSDTDTFRQDINKISDLLNRNVFPPNEVILTFILNYFIQLLKQWYESNYCEDSDTFENLGFIITDQGHILQNEALVQEVIQCLYSIARRGKDMFTSPNITVLTCLLTKYTDIATYNRYRFMERSSFADSIVKCLCAPYTKEAFAQLKLSLESEERTSFAMFVFDGLFHHIYWLNRNQLEELSCELREHLLESVSDLLDTYVTTYNQWSGSSIKIVEDLTTSFLYSVQMTLVSDVHLDIQKHICDTAIVILLMPDCRSMKFNINCLQYVYIGTLHDKILDYLKSKNLTSTLFQIASIYKNESEIQFNIYRILAAIMTEEDIKRLDDPGAIAKVFLNQLDSIKDMEGWETRIKNLLTSLKNLLQHDQLRDEIYKQNGIRLFIYCATNEKYDALIQQRALENLLIMSFSDEVCSKIKENSTFMEHIKSVSENTEKLDLQRAAESLLWRLTKDETSKTSSSNQSSDVSYDIMISYSHKDKDVVLQICDRLQNDNYRVWIDRDQMHGTPLESMSHAIENSKFVLVCMSDTYKQSGYCKMEAYYALEQQCLIIPLVMKAHYKPDGWLGLIVTGRMRIDFPKYGFEDAYQKLVTEIQRTQKEKNKTVMLHHEPPTARILAMEASSTIEEKKAEILTAQANSDHSLPATIDQWTTEDVKQFCRQRCLQCFLPICERMNGKNLSSMYEMCSMNSPVMFQSLNNQLTFMNSKDKRQYIEISEFLKFLDDLKPYVPVLVEKKTITNTKSSVCTLL